MKLSTAWRRLAQYFDAMLDENGQVTMHGGPWLCNNIVDAGCAKHYDAMYERIHDDIAAIYAGGVYDVQTYDCDGHHNHPNDNAARVLVCLMFAEEAEDAERAQARKPKRTRA